MEAHFLISRLNAISGKWMSAEVRGISQAAQAAIPAAYEYSWTRRMVSQNTALLWRTKRMIRNAWEDIRRACSVLGNW